MAGGDGHWVTPFPWTPGFKGPNGKARFYPESNLMQASWPPDDVVDTVVDHVRLYDFPDGKGFNQVQALASEKRFLTRL
jgi:hypothetical protein